MRKVWSNAGRVLLILLILGVGYLLSYFKPMPATEPALSAMKSRNAVTVTTTSDVIAFQPAQKATLGYIFYPGALVDPRAYAYYMHSLAEHGIATYIVKMPFSFAFFGNDRAANVIAAHPDIHNWVLGGHSLGGVSASIYTATHPNQIKGLVLYASYPAADISKQIASIPVLSISGSNDGLATPASIRASKPLLPADTRYVVIQGGIHSYFGEYGHQPGDGEAGISRENARAQILSQTLQFLQSIH
ncbi:alpha/beta hydrolase [Dictyobacter aurantiacus]|uniref:Alpha/beta hydrolase n=1 Tax=Dictyobacter aurantiacus TaxID=1936993 RepID=A0A401ZAG1_9CHLR|nr:alpha/beta hydrolase [Dictyobacter aurantiacus]GCE03864.1 alpha/beta hydrolase [Dictyobacter aurantiacus]